MGVFNIFKKPDLPKPDSSNSSNSDIRYLEAIIRKWLESNARDEQLLAEKYYDGDHDILYREKKVIGADGNLMPIANVANNKLVDNQYRKLVDQKTNYVLGKPLTIATENDEYLKLLTKVFTKGVHRQFRTLAQYAVDGGISWLYPHYDEKGALRLSVFPAYEVCPVWKDKAHTELDCAMRYFAEEVFDGKGGIKLIYRVDLFTTHGITHFRYQGGKLIPDENPHTDYMTVGKTGFNWDELPLIPF